MKRELKLIDIQEGEGTIEPSFGPYIQVNKYHSFGLLQRIRDLEWIAKGKGKQVKFVIETYEVLEE